jgi:hypothetical protein
MFDVLTLIPMRQVCKCQAGSRLGPGGQMRIRLEIHILGSQHEASNQGIKITETEEGLGWMPGEQNQGRLNRRRWMCVGGKH